MLENVSKKDLEKRLVESNVKLIENGENSTLYRDDENHLLVTVSYDQNNVNPYFDWSGLWNVSTCDRDINTFDYASDLIQELTDIAGANDDYLYDQLYDKPFSQTQKYLDRLGVIIVPLDYTYFGYDYEFSIDESDPTLENVSTIAYVTKDTLKKEYNSKIVTKDIRSITFDFLENALKIYNDYINGKVYCISTYDTFEDENVDSLSDIYFTDDFDDQVKDVYYFVTDMVDNVTIDFEDLKKQMKEYDQKDHRKIYLPF